ncbi:MAG: mechanosensitive ion channel family protein [Phycisphaeraceae bacterium]
MNLAVDLYTNIADFFTNGKHEYLVRAVGTLLLVGGLILLYRLIKRAIQRTKWPTPEARKRWIVTARNITVLLILGGLIVIWAQQLGDLTLYLVGVALALVIATKELLMCVGGEILRSSTRLFTVGSRIEVNGIRGDVIDLNLMTTTIMEVGPGRAAHQYTGRAIVLPNSVFLTAPVYNESFTRHYLLHTFTIAVRPDAWAAAERCMNEAAEEACASYLEVARRHIEKIGDREGLDTPAAGPRVSLEMSEPHRVLLIVRVPVPVRQKSTIEQRIVHRFFELFDETGHLKSAATYI